MRYNALATWALTALELDLRKPGFCLLRTLGKGEGNRKRPQNSGWLIKATNRKPCPETRLWEGLRTARTPNTRRCLVQWKRPGQSWQSFAPQWRPQPLPAHPVRSRRESLPHLCHLGLGEVKLGAWNSGPGKNGPQWKLGLSLLSLSAPCPNLRVSWTSALEYQKTSRHCCVLVRWGISKRWRPPWPREWRYYQQIISLC